MSDLTRRDFLQASAAGIAATALTPAAPGAAAAQAAAPRTRIRVAVNGAELVVDVEDRWTVAELLRDHLQLTGTKIGCDRGECGACTVLLDGSPIYACSYLAVWTSGRGLTTVEGLASGDRLDPLQEAFIAHDAPQCGFCTSGQLMTAKALLASTPQPTADEVRAALTGNLCRCSNYNRYVEAVLAAARTQRGADRGEDPR
ncbi:MAG TPA: (2Fe-2S)-binding protein [Vicinamibacterales bacterium]|nr:(2Fe-2S)-binding protein [Vicinamibacterales bacterium]